MKENLERQVSYYGRSQYKFLQTTNQHGELLDLDDNYDQGSDTEEREVKSLWQQTQEAARLFRCCRRRRKAREEVNAVDEAALMDDSQILDNSVLLENFEADERAPKKDLVVPMSKQDKWLHYLLDNLNKADDLLWV